MPWFYFHLRTPTGLDQDDIGLELAGVEAAYLEACHSVPEMSAELAREKKNPARYAFEITDDSDALLMDVPFSEVLDRGRRPVPPSMAAQARAAAVQLARAADLVDALREEQAVTRAKLAETWQLLAALRSVRAPAP